MRKHGFLITFADTLANDTGVHRVRNWAEDLFRDVSRRGWGTVEDLDWSTDKVWVMATSPSTTGDLAKAIARTLRHSHLAGDASVRKLTKDADWHEYQAFLSHKAARRLTRR